MNETNNLQEKKRAAYKRFAKMGAAGLAVISMSAFADLSAQQSPTKIETDSVKEKSSPLLTPTDTSFVNDEVRWFTNYGEYYDSYNNYVYNNYCNYYNYLNYSNNYSNYTNTYSNAGYSNNYSNTN